MTPSAAAAPAMQPLERVAAVLDDPLEQQRFTRWWTDGDGQRMAESSLQVSGMYCAACAGVIEQALARVDGVVGASVSAAGQRAAVRWDPLKTRPSSLIEAIRGAGYDAAPDAAAPARELRRAESRQALWRLFVAAFCMMQVMMLATPSYVAAQGELAPDLAQLLNWGSWVLSLPVLLFSARPFLAGMWRSLHQRRISMDLPVGLGVLVTFIASTGATFDPGGPLGSQVYFDSMTMFVSFLLAARFLELHARQRAAQALEQALDHMPQVALRVLAHGGIEQVSVHRLVPGDRVRVPLGQAFPADGCLLEGGTRVDEALLTGESSPVPKHCGDALVAGSVNLGAPALMQVQRVGADTRHEAIVAMMRDAMSQRPTLARVADRWAGPFLWAVVGLAALAAAVWSVLDPSRAVWVAVSVLIVTCPCALSLAAPAVLVAAAGGLARRGVLLQRLDALEGMARLDHLFIDKTGTLTTQSLQLDEVRILEPSPWLGSQDAALAIAASLAAWSKHPLSEALSSASPQAVPRAWEQVEEVAGSGLRGRDPRGIEWRLGSREWVGADTLAQAAPDDAEHAVWLGCAAGGCASFSFDEALRPGAAEAMAALRAQGLQLTLLSGDSPQRAQRMAVQLQLHAAIGAATPQDKLDEVRRAQARGERVAMVGDGVNDAPVLACADVSLAMGQGALVARAQADVVLVGNRPADIVHTLAVAGRAMRIVRQNLVWALAYNLACVPLALAGYLPPWAAGLGMATSSMLVVLNSLRAAY
jgi:Cu2+-exporting ATPase